MKPFTQEQIDNKIKYLREQLYGDTSGIYAALFIRTYYYILLCCRGHGGDWCLGREAGDWQIAKYAYKTVRDGRPDHMGNEIVYKIKKDLNRMGYISYKKVQDEWRIYINKEIDFLETSIDEFIAEDESDDISFHNDCAHEVYEYLCDNGINIYGYQKNVGNVVA